MSDDRQPSIDREQLARSASDALNALGEALRPVFEAVARTARECYDALGGAEGIARITAALEERNARRSVWEAEHPGLRYGQLCECWCARWGHRSCAAADASTFVTVTHFSMPRRLRMCAACATHVEATQSVAR